MSGPILADAVTARAELRALAVRGFTLTFLAERVGMTAQGLGGIRSGRSQHSRPYALHAIHRAYRALDGTTPADHGIPEHDAAWTRLIASRGGWGTRPAA